MPGQNGSKGRDHFLIKVKLTAIDTIVAGQTRTHQIIALSYLIQSSTPQKCNYPQNEHVTTTTTTEGWIEVEDIVSGLMQFIVSPTDSLDGETSPNQHCCNNYMLLLF